MLIEQSLRDGTQIRRGLQIPVLEQLARTKPRQGAGDLAWAWSGQVVREPGFAAHDGSACRREGTARSASGSFRRHLVPGLSGQLRSDALVRTDPFVTPSISGSR